MNTKLYTIREPRVHWLLLFCGVLLLSCSETQSTRGDGSAPPSPCQGETCDNTDIQGNNSDISPSQDWVDLVDQEPPEECTESCEDLGLECGEHCGEICGSCTGEQMACVEGHCKCIPSCNIATCGLEDGCGGTCGPCPSTQSCPDCILKLSLVDSVAIDNLLVEIILALDYYPPDNATLPSMADIRFRVTGPVELSQVGVGSAVLDAGKTLYLDPNTGKPFRVLSDGIHQILIFSTAKTQPIKSGRWLLLRLRFKSSQGGVDPAVVATQPAVIRLLKREEIFAPPVADVALWMAEFDAPVVIWPEVTP